MSKIFEILKERHFGNKPIILHRNFQVKFKDLFKTEKIVLNKIKSGSVVAIIGDYDSFTIKIFLKLIDKKTIILP